MDKNELKTLKNQQKNAIINANFIVSFFAPEKDHYFGLLFCCKRQKIHEKPKEREGFDVIRI